MRLQAFWKSPSVLFRHTPPPISPTASQTEVCRAHRSWDTPAVLAIAQQLIQLLHNAQDLALLLQQPRYDFHRRRELLRLRTVGITDREVITAGLDLVHGGDPGALCGFRT